MLGCDSSSAVEISDISVSPKLFGTTLWELCPEKSASRELEGMVKLDRVAEIFEISFGLPTR